MVRMFNLHASRQIENLAPNTQLVNATVAFGWNTRYATFFQELAQVVDHAIGTTIAFDQHGDDSTAHFSLVITASATHTTPITEATTTQMFAKWENGNPHQHFMTSTSQCRAIIVEPSRNPQQQVAANPNVGIHAAAILRHYFLFNLVETCFVRGHKSARLNASRSLLPKYVRASGRGGTMRIRHAPSGGFTATSQMPEAARAAIDE
jgi:hypothetical protein